MLDHLIQWFLHALTVMFFTGLTGCLMVVVISWVSIFRSGFSPDTPLDHQVDQNQSDANKKWTQGPPRTQRDPVRTASATLR
jgi:hypothetical protein